MLSKNLWLEWVQIYILWIFCVKYHMGQYCTKCFGFFSPWFIPAVPSSVFLSLAVFKESERRYEVSIQRCAALLCIFDQGEVIWLFILPMD